MSAVSGDGIVGVSARYAAQIRELLYAQAVQRMVAEREAARLADEAQRAAAFEAAAQRHQEEPVKVEVETRPERPTEPAPEPESPQPAAHLVDVHA